LGSIADLLNISIGDAWNLKNRMQIPANPRGRQAIVLPDEIKLKMGELYEAGLSERDIVEQLPGISRKKNQNTLKALGVVKRPHTYRRKLKG
jgi:hypothetical protein